MSESALPMANQPDDSSAENRRGFLRESSILIAGAMPGRLAVSADAHADKKPERIGIVGCGRRGIQLASRLLEKDPSATLVAMADVLPDALQRSVRTLSGRHHGQVDVSKRNRFIGVNADQGVMDAEVDTLVIAGCPADRPRQIESAVRQGFHVVSARPIAIDAEGLARFETARAFASKNGLRLHVPCELASHARVQQSVCFVRGGGVGRVLSLRALATARPLPALAKRPSEPIEINRIRNWQHFPDLSGGGPLEELADRLLVCNQIAGGLPLNAQGVGAPAAMAGESIDRLAVELNYGSIRLHAFWRRSGVDFSGSTLSAHGADGWCDVLAGKAFDHDNQLVWSAVGSQASDSSSCPADAYAATLAAIMSRDAAQSGKRVSSADLA